MSIVIGLGETGGPLQKVLGCAGYDDKVHKGEYPYLGVSVFALNICIPYSDRFVDIVKVYQGIFSPKLTIIHSTVPIGTTSKIQNAVHSPILGKHGNMEKSIRKFPKWVGGEKSFEAAEYFRDAGLTAIEVPTSEETEALKLLCLAKYGMSIAFAQYAQEIADIYDFPYQDIELWDEFYNTHVEERLRRPLITPPGKKIGGHCVTQNTKILNRQHPNRILEEICKYESA